MVAAPLLASHYDAYLVALQRSLAQPGWTGLGTVRAFMVWIEGCWQDDGLPEPDGAPAAVSEGAWGTVRWYETADGLRGYVAGRTGCYDISARESPPPLRSVSRVRTTRRHP